ncbi:unnamed protein product [Acanthosepion pharaonis]|uniref:Uncharacterized protein n=1 Tax=Acanthosepion pharaonis TaxID=158019 RepID=A0A812ESQ9_ACAPH|nr:unnamed protein product [Sepia pharaonis]
MTVSSRAGVGATHIISSEVQFSLFIHPVVYPTPSMLQNPSVCLLLCPPALKGSIMPGQLCSRSADSSFGDFVKFNLCFCSLRFFVEVFGISLDFHYFFHSFILEFDIFPCFIFPFIFIDYFLFFFFLKSLQFFPSFLSFFLFFFLPYFFFFLFVIFFLILFNVSILIFILSFLLFCFPSFFSFIHSSIPSFQDPFSFFLLHFTYFLYLISFSLSIFHSLFFFPISFYFLFFLPFTDIFYIRLIINAFSDFDVSSLSSVHSFLSSILHSLILLSFRNPFTLFS